MSAATRSPGQRRHRRRIAACTAMALALVATVLALDVGPAPQAAPGDDATGTVRGVAWVERDGDGVRDPGEAASKGLAVSLARAADGTIAGEAQTDGDGRYAFEAIPPGTYVLVVALPEGAEPAPAPTPVPGDGQIVNALTRDGAIVHSGVLEVTTGAVVEANAGILEPSAEQSTAPATEPEPEPSTAAPSETSSTTETTETTGTTGTTEAPTTTTTAATDTAEPAEPTTTSTICATAEPTGATTSTTATTTADTASNSSTTSTTSAPSTADATASSTSTTATDPTTESTTSTADTTTADTTTADTTTSATSTTLSTPDTTAPSSPDATAEPDGGCPPTTTTPPSAAPAAVDDLLAPAAVPPPTGNNAVITVRVGGDRSGTVNVTGLAGVVLRLYDGNDTAPTTPVADAFATCTSDATGDCSFIVPNTQTGLGGTNRDRQFWVVQQSAPAGWFANTSLGTGTTPVASDPYRFRTGAQLRSGTTYSSIVNFMIATGNTNNEASGGIWQNSRANPVIPPKCGANVGLLVDLSSSVGSDLGNLKQAATTFVNSLTGTPSRMSLFTFASNAPAASTNAPTFNNNTNLDTLQSVSTAVGATVVNNKITGLTLPGGNDGGTNWDRGLAQIAASANHFDVVVFITDGSPTFYGPNVEGPGGRTRFREVENGVFSANAIKASGTRLIAFGVGTGASGTASASNLISTSGPTLNNDYFQTTNYAAVGTQLRTLALGNCNGSISVVKQVIPPGGTIANAVPAGGWTFGATTTTPGVGISPASGTTNAATGALNFALTFPGGTATAPIDVAETLQGGYTPEQNAGQNATCTRLDTNAAAPGYVNGASLTQFTVTGSRDYPVSCIVYNRSPNPQASLTVNKSWTVVSNGVTTTYPEGSQPPVLAAGLTVNTLPTPWGSTATGLTAGTNFTLAETLSPLPTGCARTSSQVTLANGAPATGALPYSAALVSGANSYTITNTITCTTLLTLVKSVGNGSAVPTAWNLEARLPVSPPAGAIPGPNGATGVTAPVTPQVTYDLVESAGDPNYVQFVGPNAVITPPRTGTWSCLEVDAADVVIPGFADGLNGGVTPRLGQHVRCTAQNVTTEMVLIKDVRNTHGGTAVPANWQLTATPVNPPAGVVAQTVTGSATGVKINARPGVTYTFSESAVPGYQLQSFECATPSDPSAPVESYPWVRSDALTFSIPEITPTSTLPVTYCRFINVDKPTQVVVQKSLPSPNDNGTFALSINSNVVASGGNGASNVAAPVVVDAGSVVNLGELGLPPTLISSYSSSLTCDNGITPTPTAGVPPGTSGSFTVPQSALGVTITCTFTNTRLGATMTLAKAWVGPPDNQAVNLSITGLRGTPTGRSTNDGNTGNDTVATGPVYVGETVTLAEVFDPPGGGSLYSATLTCGGTPVTLTGTSGTFVVPPSAAAGTVSCTFTNTRRSATMTLRKTWVDGVAGDTAALTIDGQGDGNATATATGAPGSETSATSATAPLFGGDTVTVSELLGGVGSYDTALVCDQAGLTYTPGGRTGTLAVPAAPVNTTCTFTNTRQRATLTLQKTWIDGAANDTAALSINGGPAVTATATGAAGSQTSPNTATATVLSGSTVSLTEVLGAANVGGYASTLDCGGPPITLTGLTGNYTVPAAPTNVVCTFTNTRTRATLTLQKIWVNGADGATADLSINGGPPVTATATGQLGFETSPNTATATVLSGATVTLSEVLGGPGAYNSTLACGGTPISLTGLSGTYTVPAAPTNVLCTFTNSRRLATLTLRKVWVDGAANDTANLSINNGAAVTATATGAAGSETSPVTASATVFAGTTVPLTEVLGAANVGGYASTLDCGGPPLVLAGLTGFFVVPSQPADVTCTFTNTRTQATLTLQKTWVDGAANDTANLSINGGPPVTATATGAPGSETSPNTATATVLSGSTVSLTEVLGAANVGGYASTLECGGTPITLTGLTGNYTVPAAPINTTCTFTNTRQQATLTLQKIWINGADGATADLSINGGPPVAAPGTGVLGSYTSPNTATAVVRSGALVTLSEVLGGVGSYDSALDCGGTVIPLAGLSGTYTVPATPADVVCTFTNTRRLAVLTLQKVWVDGAANDTATLSINGHPPPATATATATGAAGAETSPNTATESVLSGSLVTLTEVLGGVGSYTTTLDCGGTPITLTGPGLRGTYTVPSTPPATDVVCTFTNTRQRSTLTLQKTWVDGAANDTATLSINGGPPPATATATATGAAGAETSPNTATATVLSGSLVTLTEVLAGVGSYASTLECGGTPITLTGLTGTYTATPADVVCTFTNTRQRATLTLQKTWVDGAANDTANVSINGGPPPASATATATGAPGAETSTNVATATVLSGATVTLTEVLAGTGSYTSTLQCGITTIPLTGLTGTYTVPSPAADVVCTFTNTRQRATLTLQKVWVDGAANDTATLSINGGPPPATATATATATGAAGSETSPNTATATVLSGSLVNLSEVLAGTGSYNSSLQCGTTTIPLTGLSGTYTVPSPAANVTCTFTNTRQSATLTLQKTWVNGAVGDSANLSINGGPPVTAFSNGNVGSETSPDTATATVLSGSTVTLSETLAGLGSYDSLLGCGGTPVPLAGLTGTYSVPAPAADVVCTFTNTRQLATLTLQKAWVAPVAGDTADLTLTGVLGSNTVTATAPDPAAVPAQLTVLSGEQALLGEALTGATPYATELTCVGNSGTLTHAPNSPNGTLAITPADAGATIACTFTNRAPRGTIVIVKNVEGADSTFDFTGSWLTPPEFSIATSGGTGSQPTTGVLAGTYTVAEVDPSPAYDGTGLVCTDPDGGSTPAQRASALSGTIDLDDGETVTCTFTNTQRATIVVVKDARPDGPTPFGFTGDLGPFTLVDDGTPSNTFTSQLLAANAAKRITETVPAGWTLDPALSTCSNASVFDDTGVTVTPAPGTTVTCTFVDVAGPADVTVTKSVAGIEPGTAWGPFTLAISPAGPGVETPQTVSGTGTTPVSISFASLQPGTTYTVSETAVPGWTAGPISCVATHADDSTESFGPTFPVQASDRVACALTNTLQPGRLTIDKQVSSAPAPNADGTYTLAYDIAVGNVGDGPIAYTLTDHFAFAPGVVVTKVTTVNLTPGTILTNPSFDGAANPIIASGQLASGVTDTYRVTVTANIAAVTGGPTAFDCTLQPGETGTGFLNRAQVNPTAEACAEIPYVDVAITKQVDQASVAFDGDSTEPARLVYTLVITNNGPDPAVDAVLDDELPPGVTFISAVPSTGSCAPNGPTAITCLIGTLAVGATVTVTVTGDLSSQADGTVTNTATVRSPTPDPNLANNVGVAATTVRRQGGLPIPITGAQVRSGLGVGGVLLAGGFLLLLASRRRRRTTTTP